MSYTIDLNALRAKRMADAHKDVATQVKKQLPEISKFFEYVGQWVWLREYMLAGRLTGRPRATLRELGFHYNVSRGSWQHNCGVAAKRPGGDPLRAYGVRSISEEDDRRPVRWGRALSIAAALAIGSPAQATDYGLATAADAAAQLAANVCGVDWPDIRGWVKAECFVRARSAALDFFAANEGRCSTDDQCARLDRAAMRAAKKAAKEVGHAHRR